MNCINKSSSKTTPILDSSVRLPPSSTMFSPLRPLSPLSRMMSFSSPQHQDRSHNSLDTVPPDLFRINNSQLKTLNLSGNRLRTLPTNFFNLVRLKKLDLSDNQLVRLSSELELLAELEELNVSRNNLSIMK